MVITFVVVALLFIVGLLTTLVKFPTKKLTSFFLKNAPSSHNFTINGIRSSISTSQQKKVKSGNSTSTQNKGDELKRVFDMFDKNKDGFITKQELSESLKNIGISTNERDAVEMVEKVDSNGDGLIDFDEFCNLFDSILVSSSAEESDQMKEGNEILLEEESDGELKEAFNVFDGDRDGLITVEELSLVLDSLGFKEGKKLEDCKEMIRKVDMDGDGTVNFLEFKSMMKSSASLISVS